MMRQHGDGKEAESIRCGTCRFYDLNNCYCYRYPPSIIRSGDIIAVHPRLRAADWCGEYEDFADEQ